MPNLSVCLVQDSFALCFLPRGSRLRNRKDSSEPGHGKMVPPGSLLERGHGPAWLADACMFATQRF